MHLQAIRWPLKSATIRNMVYDLTVFVGVISCFWCGSFSAHGKIGNFIIIIIIIIGSEKNLPVKTESTLSFDRCTESITIQLTAERSEYSILCVFQ